MLAPDDHKSYDALAMTAVLPLVSPNSVPSVVCMYVVHLMSSPPGHLVQQK